MEQDCPQTRNYYPINLTTQGPHNDTLLLTVGDNGSFARLVITSYAIKFGTVLQQYLLEHEFLAIVLEAL